MRLYPPTSFDPTLMMLWTITGTQMEPVRSLSQSSAVLVMLVSYSVIKKSFHSIEGAASVVSV